jgi:hypothetical protein
MKNIKLSKIGFSFVAILLVALTGCYSDAQRPATVYGQPPPAYVEDDYVYYPGYEVYYGGRSHQYVYRDGGSWVSRRTPPRVSTDVLLASPSVRLGFHDSPAGHHSEVVRQYPKQWTPPQGNRGHEESQNHRN